MTAAVNSSSSASAGDNNSSISVRMDQARLAEVNGALVSGGVNILTVSEVSRSLEDLFMALTGGGGSIE